MLDYYWVDYGYPVGAFPPLGIGHVLTGVDVAWLFQPYLCFLAAMLALGLYGLLSRLVESRPLRALSAFVAAQPALLYGYSLWGGVKELVTAALFDTDRRSHRRRRCGGRVRPEPRPLAVATAAPIGVLNFGGASACPAAACRHS